MTETITGEVIHVVPPEDLDDYELDPDLQSLAETRYVLVCRKGGRPSWVERIVAFLRRTPIEPVTLVADRPAEEGEDVTASVESTGVTGVYDVIEFR
ncbi:DUF7526 family protein [Haloarcula pellucida]|uniref:Uncharacterized protein n=1 Tax=Haloarcula pellucida TaxID=1427151 RepID=A0A830GPA8_9EURY|nr:hypothetical protein [Halomicroarcula pellucida]MBX0348261.1 hypothetical protein [Halomicroarcula pellucida]GGN97740.1 hypothetical protein GCM10009030_27300 [Halomicroarcula pellucida]